MQSVLNTRVRRALGLALSGALALGASVTILAQGVQINGAGATFPYPDLLEVVLRVQQDQAGRADQLPVDRLGRRHPPAHQPDGVLRRHRRPDDDGPDAGRRPARSCTCRPCSAPWCPSTTSPRRRRELKFSGPVLADIFLGKVTKWNDPAIAKLNAGVTLPATDITVVHRSDGLGHHVHLRRLSWRRSRRSGRRRSASPPRSTGRSGSAARATRVWPAW